MSAAARTEPDHPLHAVFERYHVGWVTRDPDRIAAAHSADTIFWLHDGSAPVEGREALRAHCREMFRKFDFTQETNRLFYGEDHWVYDWTMILTLAEPGGTPFTARVEMLDVVTVNAAGEAVRKDVYMNGAQANAAFSRAGIVR